jgi:hypothetical protein
MGRNYLFVNHTKKHIVLIEDLDTVWNFIFRLLKVGWKETDSVELMHEIDDYINLKYYVKHENYTHDFGDEVFM